MRKIVLTCLVFLVISSFGYCKQMQDIDKNKDGKTDNWIVRDDKNIPIKWIKDTNFDGKEDSWSFFKNGKVFLEEIDSDEDGRVDEIYLIIFDSETKKLRTISLILEDMEKSIFIEKEDTGWVR